MLKSYNKPRRQRISSNDGMLSFIPIPPGTITARRVLFSNLPFFRWKGKGVHRNGAIRYLFIAHSLLIVRALSQSQIPGCISSSSGHHQNGTSVEDIRRTRDPMNLNRQTCQEVLTMNCVTIRTKRLPELVQPRPYA